MIKVTVFLFANLRDKAGVNRVDMEIPEGTTVGDLKIQIVNRYPALVNMLNHIVVSIEQKFAFDEDIITADSEVAFFPPVSGGNDYPTIVKIVDHPLNHDEIIKEITQDITGAVCIFSGIVRGKTERGFFRETNALEYEAYLPMAEQKMIQIADEMRTKYTDIQGVAIIQRIGLLEVGTPTVIVACSAAHRDTGIFEAAKYGIDRLKEIVPVWKKEIGPDGNEWVEGKYHPGKGD